MTENKKECKGFLLFIDQYEPIKGMTLEQKGMLLDAMFTYNLHGDVDIPDPLVRMAFGFFKAAFDRDNQRRGNLSEIRREAVNSRKDRQGTNSTNATNVDFVPDEEQTDTNATNATNATNVPKRKEKKREEKKQEEITIPANSKFAGFVRAFQNSVTERYGNTAPKLTDSLVSEGVLALEQAERIDGFDEHEMQDALSWAHEDSFWGPNVKSLAQIRKKGADGTSKLQKIMGRYRQHKQTVPEQKPFWDRPGHCL